jgi:hypothetical protein
VLEGAPVIGGLRGEPRHHFCPGCMSWMFTRMPVVGFVNVRPTMLDDASWFSPFVETYLSERLPWASTPAVHGFQAFPAFEDWARLSEAYAAQAEPPVA